MPTLNLKRKDVSELAFYDATLYKELLKIRHKTNRKSFMFVDRSDDFYAKVQKSLCEIRNKQQIQRIDLHYKQNIRN